MYLEILDIYRSGNHYILQSRQEKGDVALDDNTVLVTDNETEAINQVIGYFQQNPKDRLLSVIVVKGKRLFVIKSRNMYGIHVSNSSKILDAVQLSSEIMDHLEFHVVKTLSDLAA